MDISGFFTLTVYKILPGDGEDAIVGALSGKIKANSNGKGAINFTDLDATIAPITYAIIGTVLFDSPGRDTGNKILFPDVARSLNNVSNILVRRYNP